MERLDKQFVIKVWNKDNKTGFALIDNGTLKIADEFHPDYVTIFKSKTAALAAEKQYCISCKPGMRWTVLSLQDVVRNPTEHGISVQSANTTQPFTIANSAGEFIRFDSRKQRYHFNPKEAGSIPVWKTLEDIQNFILATNLPKDVAIYQFKGDGTTEKVQ